MTLHPFREEMLSPHLVVYAIMYIQMRLTWDEAKNRSNRRKHGISFDTAASFSIPCTLVARIGSSKARSVGKRLAWSTAFCSFWSPTP